MDNQTHCSVEDYVELLHADTIHSSKDSITVVYATANQSVR